MLNKLSIVLLLAVITAFGINTLEAQIKTEKKISIVKKTIGKDGKEKIDRIEVIGDEADKYLKELELSKSSKHIEVNVEVEGADTNLQNTTLNKYKMVVLDDNGNQKVLEWNGVGEMPEEMKAQMDEKDIDFLIEDELLDSNHKKVKMKFTDNDGKVQNLESEDLNIKRKEIINEDGTKAVQVEVDVKEIEEGIEQSIEGNVNIANTRSEEVIVEVIEENNNKAQLGIMIGNAAGGVGISDFAPNSNAEIGGLKIGDVITQFNGTEVITLESLISEVGKYNAGDTVKVKFKRGTKNMEKLIELTPRSGASKKKFKWKQAGQQ